MSGIELLPFQARASEQIAERYAELVADERRPLVHRHWDVPFYQALNALTGAGKTPILADAVAQIRASMPGEPIVLWVSKAKAVVDQTHLNFSAGGKYEGLIAGFVVGYLSELRAAEVADALGAAHRARHRRRLQPARPCRRQPARPPGGRGQD